MKGELFYCDFFEDKTEFYSDCVRGTPTGFTSPRLAYIVNGECVCVSEDGDLYLKQGDVWSLPAKKGYKSIWTAKPKVEFYFIQYEADFVSLSVKKFRKIENCDIYNDFKALHESKNDFERLSLFYRIIFKTAPLISEQEKYNIEAIFPALKYIRDNFERSVKVNDLATLCFMSQSKFFTEFKKITGLSPIDYKNRLKVSKASEMILNGATLEEVCERLNYSSPAFLRRQMLKFSGKTPRELREQYKML